MFPTYTPNEKIIDHAVALWKKALHLPVYDAGYGGMGLAMAMLQLSKGPNNSTDEVLEKFGVELKKLLMVGKPIPDSDGKVEYIDYLRVDYDPCKTLSKAAQIAGLETAFPVKTTMYIYNDHVKFSIGYGQPGEIHYPLKDGRWLVTSLQGDDMSIILNHLNDNTPLTFKYFEA